MLNFFVYHSKKLLLAAVMSFFVLSFMLISTSSASAIRPVAEYRIGVEEVPGAGKTAADPGTPIKQQGNLAAAVSAKLINPLIYRYNPANPDAYVLWNVETGQNLETDSKGLLTTKLTAWEAMQIQTNRYFWLEQRFTPPSGQVYGGLYYTDKITLAFDYPDGYTPVPYVDVPVPSESCPVTNQWKMISIPLTTAGDGPSNHTNLLFDKIKNLDNPGHVPPYSEYINLGTDFAPDFVPGRGYWVTTQSPTGSATSLSISGIKTKYNHQFEFEVGGYTFRVNQYSLKVPSEGGDGKGTHMIGNPYQVDRELKTLWFEMTPDDYSARDLAKVASGPTYEDLNAIKTWDIKLKLSDTQGVHLDGDNMAGVLETGKDFHEVFCAPDMVAPIPEYIRLAFKNPDDASSMLAWDFRGPGQDKYEWNVELSTNIASIATKLSLDNFKEIPSDYAVTLTDTQTGTVYSLTGDSSFDVALTSSTPKNFVLTATRQKPVVVAEAGPVALALNNIFPNPFNPSTTISFDVKKAGVVNLGVYNISGQLVATLVNSPMTAGSHQIVWNAARNSSGVYIVRLTSNGFTDTKKVTFMK